MAPATAQEIALHQRLLEGDETASDETASAEVFDRYLDDLARHLAYRYPGIALHNDGLIDETAADTLFDYIDRPEAYDPQKKCLGGYLRMAAEGDLLNRWRKVPQPEKAGQLTSLEGLRERAFDAGDGASCYRDDADVEMGLAPVVCQAWQAVLAQVPRGNSKEIVEFLDKFVELGVKGGNRYIEGNPDVVQQSIDEIIVRRFWRQVQILMPDPQERQVMVLLMGGMRETEAYAQVLAITNLTKEEQANTVKRVKDKLKKRLQRADWQHLVEGSPGVA